MCMNAKYGPFGSFCAKKTVNHKYVFRGGTTEYSKTKTVLAFLDVDLSFIAQKNRGRAIVQLLPDLPLKSFFLLR